MEVTTRLRAAALEEGCTNLVNSPAPMEKSSQLIMTLGVVWLIVSVPAPPAMDAAPLPGVTTPPIGFARAAKG